MRGSSNLLPGIWIMPILMWSDDNFLKYPFWIFNDFMIINNPFLLDSIDGILHPWKYFWISDFLFDGISPIWSSSLEYHCFSKSDCYIGMRVVWTLYNNDYLDVVLILSGLEFSVQKHYLIFFKLPILDPEFSVKGLVHTFRSLKHLLIF